MTEIHQAKPRLEAKLENTWDLTSLYENDEQWEKAFQEVEAKVPSITKLQGSLGQSAEQLEKTLEQILDFNRNIENVYVYAHLKSDQDTTNDYYQNFNDRSRSLTVQASQATSWFQPEFLSLDPKTIDQFMAENENLKIYSHYFDQLDRERPHTLSQAEEDLLAGAGEIFSASSQTFSMLDNADLKFESVKDKDGKEITLTHGSYGALLENSDRQLRKDTFESYYRTYDSVKNTTASTLSSHVKGHNYFAKVRKYESARQYSLANNYIPESVYDTLLEEVHHNLPLLHRYYEIRKEALDLEEQHMYDLYTPITGEAPMKFTFEKAKELTLKALAPLGEDYLAIIQKAFDERWIDIYENIGKRSGAYSSGSYDSKPYILMNWQDSLNDVYTLVHELGHSVHSYLTHQEQTYLYGDYSIFLAEIASTTNENLLTAYLLENYPEEDMQVYVLNQYLDGFKGTVFRQSQFAEFEQWIHETDAKGIPLTQASLSEKYLELNKTFYGDAVISDSQIALEWSRIPHFYYNFYVYQYSTGFAAATALSEAILTEDQTVVDKYLNYLKSGSSDYPIEVMKKAGVDMTQSAYLETAMEKFEQRLNELEKYLVK